MAHNVPYQFESIAARNAVVGNQFQGDANFNFYNGPDESQKLQAEKEACLRSLAFSELRARQQYIDPPHTDTCDWLFQTPEFQQWRYLVCRHAHNGVLWIKGKPGAGKSTLMKHTLSRCQTDFFDDHLIVAYFFNARGSTLEKTPLGLVRSITYQLLRADDVLYTQFAPLYRENQMLGREATWQWRLSELQDFIRLVVKQSQSRPLLFLVDALDECDECDVRSMVEFLESLSICASKDGIPLRVCLSSRHYPTIQMARVAELAIDRSLDHQRDITKYIRERLRVSDVGIEAEIAKKADSVFLWVVIVVSLLNKAYDEGRVEAMRRTLEEIPGDLDRIFSTILGRDTTDAGETILMLQWVLLSRRPLRSRELFAATIRTAPPAIELIERRITTSSKGLIEVRKGKEGYVQFIHLSVSDFLFRNKRLQMLDPTLEPEPVTAIHGRLWAQCWSCIQQVDTTQTSEQQMIEQNDKNPFLKYAASYILDHAERALTSHVMRQETHGKQKRGEEVTNAATPQQVAIHQWLRGLDHWFRWWKLFTAASPSRLSDKSDLKKDVDGELVYILTRYGLRSLLGVVLEGADVNAQGGYHGNALQAASAEGRVEIVQLLLSAGAEVNGQGGLHGSALQAASRWGYKEIVQLLLNAGGTKVNAQGGFYGSALQAASAEGHVEIVQLLLSAGAKDNRQGGFYGSALQAASCLGHNKIVQLLLNAGGTEVNAQGGEYGSALQAALAEGHVEIVQLLISAGAKVNRQGGKYGSALQAASAEGHMEIVQLLLSAGAEVNGQGGFYGSALQAASRWGYKKIIQLLLNAGAEVNAQGGEYGNALQAASYFGRQEIIQLLLNAGAKVNAQGGKFGSTLQAALTTGNKEIIQLLLKAGAKVNTQGGKYGNALQAALLTTGNKEIVQLLLNAGANVNAQGGEYGTALQAALLAKNGHQEIIQLLLNAGANVNAQGGEYGTALQAASAKGDREIVQLLLNAGAKVNTKGGYYGNALRAALATGNKEIVQLLRNTITAKANEVYRTK